MNYFDLHCDALYKCVCENIGFDSDTLTVNSNQLNLFDNYYQCFAVWTPPQISDKKAFLEKSVFRFKSSFFPFLSDTFKPILTIEGADFLNDDITLLELLRDIGVFSVSLTWNEENAFAGGAHSLAPLKQKGKDLIKLLNQNGIVLDLSHLNTNSFYGAVEYADNIIASHSFICELCPNNRNLTLEQMRIIKEKNGLVGLCFYPAFLGSENIFERIYQAIIFCGENDLLDIVSIGSDFDGAEMPFVLNDIPDLFSFLLLKGIDSKTLEAVFFNNAFRYCKSLK